MGGGKTERHVVRGIMSQGEHESKSWKAETEKDRFSELILSAATGTEPAIIN